MKQTNYFGLFFFILLTFQLTVITSIYAETGAAADKVTQAEQAIIISSGDTVFIEIKDASLHETLKAITQKSKINFEVPESLLNDKITFRSTSRDWPETLKKMLNKYNIAFGWEKTGLEKVFIFEHGTGRVLELIPDTADNTPAPVDDSTTVNEQLTDEFEDNDQAFQSMPPFPEEEDKIIEIKDAARDRDSQKKKPDLGKGEDFSKDVSPELPGDIPEQEIPARNNIKSYE